LNANAGGLAASLGAGVGGSLAENDMAASVKAGIGGAKVTTTSGGVDILAMSNFKVDADGLGFSVAGLIGGVGTATINDLANKTKAFIDDGAVVDSAAAVSVVARDTSAVSADAGGLAAGGLVGAGLSFASSKVVDNVDAVIDGETTSVTANGALTLTATLTPDVSANAVGFSASAFAAASGAVSVSESGGTAHAGSRARRR
jgi:hypothetical protein